MSLHNCYAIVHLMLCQKFPTAKKGISRDYETPHLLDQLHEFEGDDSNDSWFGPVFRRYS